MESASVGTAETVAVPVQMSSGILTTRHFASRDSVARGICRPDSAPEADFHVILSHFLSRLFPFRWIPYYSVGGDPPVRHLVSTTPAWVTLPQTRTALRFTRTCRHVRRTLRLWRRSLFSQSLPTAAAVSASGTPSTRRPSFPFSRPLSVLRLEFP